MEGQYANLAESGSPVTFSFHLEPKPQKSWGIRHAFWFFAMGVGAALYLNELLFGIEVGYILGMSLSHVLGLVFVGVGGLILISDLGRPERFWRALLNPRRSWIAVGAICDFLFMFLDSLYVLPSLTWQGEQPLAGLAWGDGWFAFLLHGIAAASAFVIIVYPGLVLSSSPSIPFWNTTLIPLQYLFFAFTSAISMALAFRAAQGESIPEGWVLTAILLLCTCLLLTVSHLISAYQMRGTARESARRLLRGPFMAHLWLGVFVVGLTLPLILLALASHGTGLGAPGMIGIGLLSQVGNFYSKLGTLRVGLYPPIL
jgi:formate-dependent nitrite reductase membrane component NrfD